jgi:hypothetical protein
MPDIETFKNRLKRMTAWESEPALADEDVDELLAIYAKADMSDNTPDPDNEDWSPSFDLNAAAAEGWRWKAAKASEMIAADLDGAKLSAEQLFEHCERMIGIYAKRVRNTVSVSP